MKMYEVAVLAPLQKTLTYFGPEEGGQNLQPGQRVLVPLGRRLVTGYILGPAAAQDDDPGYTVRAVREILNPEPVFPAGIIPFYRWIAEYYHFPIGEVIRTALPGGLSAGSGKRIRLVPDCREDLLNAAAGDENLDRPWFAALLEKGELTPAAVAKLYRNPKQRTLLARWEKNGWVTIEEEISRPQLAAKKQMQVRPSETLRKVLDENGQDEEKFLEDCAHHFDGLKKSELNTLAVVRKIDRGDEGRSLVRADITRLYSGAGKALKELHEKGILFLEEKRVYRDLFGEEQRCYPQPEKLTPEQERVLGRILSAVEEESFHTFLLHGVTGCGKTEVYLRAAAKALDKGKNVLVLVPEIALTTQLEAHFHSRFGDRLALLHSGLSTAERHDQWQRILSGRAGIVIGARSAVFAPIPRLGLIVVDEEHEPSYKQEDGLHYNGRDLAVLRGRFAQCLVILGSATPSVISYHHARSGKYELLQMERRVFDQILPEVTIVDLTEDRKSRPDLFFSDQLSAALWENLENRRQSLLFVNRRGFASFMLCSDCGHIIQCRHCNVSLTLHRSEQRLICHYCGYSLTTRIICPDCGSRNMKALGIGSERIEDEVRQILPHARIARLDSDTASNRKQYLRTLRGVYENEVDVLIGTQMIAKGLHFPNLTLVGVVWADSGLGIPDFRASERTFQLLSQVTGRAGRGEHPGRVIIQTYHPNHYSVLHAQQHDYMRFFEREIALRREVNYPPFARLVNIRLSAKDERKVKKGAEVTGSFLRSMPESRIGAVEILGPAPAPLMRLKDQNRWQVMIKSSRIADLHRLCRRLQERFAEICPGNIRMVIDVDPENMM